MYLKCEASWWNRNAKIFCLFFAYSSYNKPKIYAIQFLTSICIVYDVLLNFLVINIKNLLFFCFRQVYI